MSDKKADKNTNTEKRRKLLKTVAAGGGAIIAGKTLPEKWSKPAIDSVLLPAHAQTSGTGTYSGATRAALETDSLFAKALDTLIPQSHARPRALFDITWCITPTGPSTANVSFLMVEENVIFAELWSASNVPVGVPTPLSFSDGCASYASARDIENNWLNELGLVNDAQAASVSAQVTLNGVNPGDTFLFENFRYGIDLTEMLVVGLCGPESVENCKGRRL